MEAFRGVHVLHTSRLASAVIHGLEHRLGEVQKIFVECGPTPGLCFDCVEDPSLLTTFQERREEQISKLSLRYLLKFAHQRELKLDVSHSVFLV